MLKNPGNQAISIQLSVSVCRKWPALLSVFLLLGSSLTAAGLPVPGRWQKVTALEPDTGIILYLEDGTKLESRFQAIVDRSGETVKRDDFRLAGDRVWTGYSRGEASGEYASLEDDGFLACSDMSGNQKRIPLGYIERIVQPQAGQYAREWAVWGAVGGAAAGTLVSTASFDNLTPTGHLLSALAGAGIGALAGSLSGSAAGSPGETIYISVEAARKNYLGK